VGFKQVTVFDVQGADVPQEVKDKVRVYWSFFEVPEDQSYYQWIGKEEHEGFQLISEYIRDNGEDPDDGSVLIHYWW
jgi:hypothetical protein